MESTGKKNVYICEKCKRKTITVNLADGVTPFMIQCRADGMAAVKVCDGMAQSSFYMVDQSLPADWGWYKPSPDQIEKMSAPERDHVQRGGLKLRRLDAIERETYGGHRTRFA